MGSCDHCSISYGLYTVDEAGLLVGRHRNADVDAGRLDATRDQRGRVEQRAVPVERDQVKLSGLGHGPGMFGVRRAAARSALTNILK